METRLASKTLVYAFVIVCLAVVAIDIVPAVYTSPYEVSFANSKYTYVDTKLKPLQAIPPDSLEHANQLYQKFNDSLNLAWQLKNAYFPGTGMRVGPIGTTESMQCDNCNNAFWMFNDSKKQNRLPGLVLYGWGLKESNHHWNMLDSVIFFIQNNRFYIRKNAQLSQDKVKVDGKMLYPFGVVDQPVKFRYDKLDKSIVIPVSPGIKSAISILLTIFGLLYACYLLALLGSFIRFVIGISKGIVFTDLNVRRLHWIAFSLMALPILGLLFTFSLRLIFNSYFTDDVILKPDTWEHAWKPICAGLLFLALGTAFKRGKKLQEDQDLTI